MKKKTPIELHKESLNPNNNIVEIYNRWAETYDNYVDSLDYMGPKNIVLKLKSIISQNKSSKLSILDFGCGTGKIGEQLNKIIKNPYYLEGVDISENMLKIAKQKGNYNILTNIDLTTQKYHKKYDIILSSGVFLEGHIDISNIDKLVDLLYNNGLLLFTIRETFKENNKEDFLKYVLNNPKFTSISIINIEYLKNVDCKLVILQI